MGHFLIKNKELKRSYIEELNFLYQDKNIYIMDNHRAALWATLKELNLKERYNYFHLDAHYDSAYHPQEKFTDLAWIQQASLEQFIDYKSTVGEYALFRWDNYMPILFSGEHFRRKVSMTHQIGINPCFQEEFGPWELTRILDKVIVDELRWVINLDLDYFYAREFKKHPMFSKEFIQNFFERLKYYYDQGDIALITVALSPECCGGWEQSFSILDQFNHTFNLDFSF